MCRPAGHGARCLRGFSPVEVRDLRVLAGQTVTLDFTLESTPVQLQGIEVIAAQNPLVPATR